MATVYSRERADGKLTWYTKVKQPNGIWKPVALKTAKTEPQARKLAFEIEQQQERMLHGLEPGALFHGTFAELCHWSFVNHFSRLRGAQPDGSRLRHHVGDPTTKPPRVTWLGALPAAKVTHHVLERYFAELSVTATVRGAPMAASGINRLRAQLSSVFSLASRHGLWAGDNPARKTVARPTVDLEHDFLAAHEIGPVLAALSPYWRGCLAVGIFAGLRKGELFALEKRDVDLERRVFQVRRSHEHQTTKGGRMRTVPIHEDLVPYVEAWMKTPGPLLFPDREGGRRSRKLKVELILRAAMVRAGIIDHWDHKCRRCRKVGAGGKPERYVERHADGEPRRCPACAAKLWPVARARKIRWHEGTRHTFASHTLMSGASIQSVQDMLGHRDPKITTRTYGHLTSSFLQREINRLSLPGFAKAVDTEHPVPPDAAARRPEATACIPEGALAGDRGALVVRAPVGQHHDGGGQTHDTAENMLDCEWSRSGSNRRPMHCERIGVAFAPDATVAQASQTFEIVRATGVPLSHASSAVVKIPAGRGAPMVRAKKSRHQKTSQCIGAGSSPGEPDTTEQLLTVREVAARLSVSTAWVYRHVESGDLGHVRLGASNQIRVLASALEAYLQRFPGIESPRPPEPAQPARVPRARKGAA